MLSCIKVPNALKSHSRYIKPACRITSNRVVHCDLLSECISRNGICTVNQRIFQKFILQKGNRNDIYITKLTATFYALCLVH